MHRAAARIALVLAFLATATLTAQHMRLPSEPVVVFGSSVTGAYDGWFVDANGDRWFLVGYFNRNTREVLDIPVGPNNRIEPGGPDLGQPTTFLPGRHIGMFIVRAPKQFTAHDSLTWTLVSNGETTRIPLRLKPDYYVSPFGGEQVGNEPPLVRFVDHGPALQGPTSSLASAAHLSARVGTPQPLSISAEDDARYTSGTSAVPRNPPPPVAIHWSKYRGPGAVTFERDRPALSVLRGGGVGEPFAGRGTTTATFAAPGEYVLHASVNDFSGEGGGGEVCCWTNVLVRVTVE
ncbi:MAG: hypothetical protein QM736_26180 [Vicinamibacterales bacterium]